MKNHMLRLLCALLCLSVGLTGAAAPARAQETEQTETAEYRDRVSERYDQSFEVSDYYENLQLQSNYLYEQWAESVDNMPGYKEFFTSVSDALLDKKLDEEAYTEYLLKLMQMVEAGFDDTAASQAMYTARVNAVDLLDGGVTIIAKLLGASAYETFADIADYTDAGIDLMGTLGGTIHDSAQLALVSAGATLYEEKITILRAISEHAEDEELKKAAQSLMEATTLQFVEILEEGTTDLALTGADVAMTGFKIQNYADLVHKLYEKSLPTLQKAAEKYVNAESAKKVLGAVSKGLASLVPVFSGFVIGSETMKLAVGDEAECYREMKAMAEISEALALGMQGANNAALATDPDERYEAIREYVAVGEALVYSRLRGDYCYLLSTQITALEEYIDENREQSDAIALSVVLQRIRLGDDGEAYDMDELIGAVDGMSIDDVRIERFLKIAEYYDYLEMNLEAYYEVLSGIFPDNTPQVIVTTELVRQEGDNYYYAAYVPRVEVVGYEEATGRINEEIDQSWLPNAEEARAAAAEFCQYAQEHKEALGSGLVPFNTLYLEQALCIGDALSLQMRTSAAGDSGTASCSFLFDITTGEKLGVLDMLDPEQADAKEKLIGILADEIEEQVGWVWTTYREVAEALVYEKKYQGADLSNVFGVDGEGLVMQFSSGDIVPVMGGSPRVVVSYEKLSGIFSSRFMPADKAYTGKTRFYLTAENLPKPEVRREHGEAGVEAVHVVSDVYDVRIDETRYAQSWNFDYGEQYGGVVFYANYLTNELVWIPENPGGDFVLSYDDKTEFYRAEK